MAKEKYRILSSADCVHLGVPYKILRSIDRLLCFKSEEMDIKDLYKSDMAMNNSRGYFDALKYESVTVKK